MSDSHKIQQVTVNSNVVNVQNDGHFSYDLKLSEDVTPIAVRATDVANNSTEYVFTVRLDTTGPKIIVDIPSVKDGGRILTNSLIQRIVGSVIAPTGVSNLSINGENIKLHSSGAFSYNLSLKKVTTQVLLVAKDSVGNVSRFSFVVIRDTIPPRIVITEPRVMRGMVVVTEGLTKRVEGVVKDENGVAAVVGNGKPVAVRNDSLFSFDVSMVTDTMDVTIAATDSAGNVAQYSFRLSKSLPPRSQVISRSGVDYALLFAADNYDEWNTLVNPVNDARNIAKELRESYGFKTEVVENAAMDQILSRVRKYAGMEFGEDDQLFIFFAGHGQFDDVLGEGYIVASDSKLRDEVKTSYIAHSVLRTYINSIPCKHIFLVVDACFVGTLDPLIASNIRGDTEYQDVSKTEFIQRKMKFRTRRFLTSGGKEYVSDGRPGQHSPFTRKLLEALRSYGGRDAVLTIPEILMYAEKLRPEP